MSSTMPTAGHWKRSDDVDELAADVKRLKR